MERSKKKHKKKKKKEPENFCNVDEHEELVSVKFLLEKRKLEHLLVFKPSLELRKNVSSRAGFEPMAFC